MRGMHCRARPSEDPDPKRSLWITSNIAFEQPSIIQALEARAPLMKPCARGLLRANCPAGFGS